MSEGIFERRDPLVIGHRGAAARAPENTLASFEKAIGFGADVVELDVQLSKDGELVVIHDRTVDRTTNGSGRVGEMTLSELKALDAGMGEVIPTLREVMDLIGGRCGMNIELKGPGTAISVHGLLMDALGRGDMDRGMFLISSFDPITLKEFSQLRPRFDIGVLVEDIPEGAEEFANMLGAVSVHPDHRITGRDHIDLWHEWGFRVFPWTVNDGARIRELLSWGADGIMTDDPALMSGAGRRS